MGLSHITWFPMSSMQGPQSCTVLSNKGSTPSVLFVHNRVGKEEGEGKMEREGGRERA